MGVQAIHEHYKETQVLIWQLSAVQLCYPNVDFWRKNWNFWSYNFEKITRQIWEDNLVKVVTSHLKIDTWMLKRGIYPSIGFLFSNPSTADVFNINRSVLITGILNEVLFMVVWRIYSLYPQSYHMDICISFWQIMHTLLSKNRLFAVKHDMNVT